MTTILSVITIILGFHLVEVIGEFEHNLQQNISSHGEPLCDIVSFSETTGIHLQIHLTRSLSLHNFCHSISTNVPTTVTVNAHKGCYYQITGFWGSHCEDDTEMKQVATKNSSQAVVNFNEHKQICSFKLVEPPRTWVTIAFTGGSSQPVLYQVRHSNCYDLCHSSSSTYYPESVVVYEGNGPKLATSSPIELYSHRHCEADSLITNVHGRTAITSVQNLSAITSKSNPADQVRSYKIALMRMPGRRSLALNNKWRRHTGKNAVGGVPLKQNEFGDVVRGLKASTKKLGDTCLECLIKKNA